MVINHCDMKRRTRKILIVAILFICLAVCAEANLRKRINAIVNHPSQSKVRFSIQVIKADSGKTACRHNAKTAMLPASNMKIIVSAAALKYLGPNYEYKTIVGLSGDTLVVIGSGDPLLGDQVTDVRYGREDGWIFADIATKLKENNVTAVNDIVIDTTVFDDQRAHPNWPKEQLNQWYACEVSGLNFNDNCVDITAKTFGSKVVVYVQPRTDFLKIVNQVTAIQQGKSAVGVYRTPGKLNRLVVRGKCKKQAGPVAIAIERPAAFFGFLLAEHLAKAGINTTGQFMEKPAALDHDFKMLAQYKTPIKDCLTRCNKNSLGLAAEALLKTLAAHRNNGKNGSWQSGAKVISEYLTDLGINDLEFHIDDGSGLSRKNRLSANAITKTLSHVYKNYNWQLYKDTLAIGGVDGTIGKYFKAEKYKGKIRGKTGYIAGVKSFSGVCNTSKGDYIFSILTNSANGKTRKAINDIAKAIIDDAEI